MAVKLTTKIPTTRAKPKDKTIQPVSALYADNIGTADTSYKTNISYMGNNMPSPDRSPLQQKVPTSLTPSTANTESTTPNTETKTAQTPSSEPVDSYAQWLINNGKNIEQSHNDTVAAIDQQKETAVQAAETERQRGIVDARSSYAQNLANYGANAEAMQSMGLQGSGYSEYLNSQAYAQQRAEVQGANAQAQAAKAAAEQQANQQKISADLSYQQNLAANDQALTQYQQEQTENKKANYMAAVSDINAYGSELDGDYLDNLLEMNYISHEQYNSLKEKYSKKVVNEYKSQITTANTNADYAIENGDNASFAEAMQAVEATLQSADQAYGEGKITQAEHQRIYSDGQRIAIKGLISQDYGDNYTQSALDFKEANKELDDLYNTGKLSKTDYNSLKAELNSVTKKHSKYYIFHHATYPYGETNLVRITFGQNRIRGDKEYSLKLNGNVTDSNVTAALNKLATGSDIAPETEVIVVYGNKMYYNGGALRDKVWINVQGSGSNISDAIKEYLKYND